jgi:glucosamine kinase
MRNYPVAYYLGIDGGGTKTTCAVGDEVALLATAIAGASNMVRAGEAEARRSLHRAIEQACAAAGISPQQIARTCVGAAGAGSDAIATTIRRAVAEIVSGEVVVTGDMQIALEAAFPGAPGIVVIAGTGSIAYGRNEQGSVARAGGWGFAVSDEGSAYWIGRNAVSAVFRAWDGMQRGFTPGRQEGTHAEANPAQLDVPLFHALRQNLNVTSMDDLVRAANATPPPNFAALLPAVVACSDAGDKLAQEILTRAAGELAQLAALIIPKLFYEVGAKVSFAMVGGVFRHSGRVREVFYNEVRKLSANAEMLAQVVDPVEGALHLARST